MEIILGSTDKFKTIKTNAFWTNVHLDTSFRPDVDHVRMYKDHLTDWIKNPTVGLMADQKYINGKSHNYSEFYRNKQIIESDSGVKSLKRNLKARIQKLYPSSQKIREYIASGDRLELDYVKKSKGYNFIDKLKIAFR